MENPNKQYDDTEIWSRLMAKDSECIRWVIRRYGAGLINYLVVRDFGNYHDAEDIFVEALMTAIDNIRAYDPERAKFSTWLYRIALNKAIDFLRKNKNATKLFEPLAENTVSFQAGESADNTAIIDLFQRSFEQLATEDRDLLRLRYNSGWCHREIANRLKITEGNCRVRLKRAVKRLKDVMAQDRSKGGDSSESEKSG